MPFNVQHEAMEKNLTAKPSMGEKAPPSRYRVTMVARFETDGNQPFTNAKKVARSELPSSKTSLISTYIRDK
jgi:hypothetical protein